MNLIFSSKLLPENYNLCKTAGVRPHQLHLQLKLTPVPRFKLLERDKTAADCNVTSG